MSQTAPIESVHWFEQVKSLEPERREHFDVMIAKLLECYINEEKMATILLCDTQAKHVAMLAVNATRDDVEEMIVVAHSAINPLAVNLENTLRN